jgi:glycosyltransferase involved in cell wall biosynthesis
MKLITIGSDRKVFEEGSAVRQRLLEYGELFEEIHSVVFSKRALGFEKIQIAKNVWVYPTNSFSRWTYIQDAVSVAKRIGGDAMTVVSGQDPFECGLAAFFSARKIGAKFHVQIHTDFLSPYFKKESFLNRLRVWIASFTLPKADGIRVVSRRIIESFNNHDYSLKNAPALVPIFVDAEKIRRTEPTIDLHKKYPQFSSVVLMVSRLSSEKNISFAIALFAKLLVKHPKAGLVIVGSGPQEKILKKQVDTMLLGESVIFEGWQKDVVSYYKTADVVLQTSFYEGYGISLVEAVFAGCPVVSSDAGIAKYLFPDATVSLENPGSFVENIDKCLSDFSYQNALVSYAQEYVSNSTFSSKQAYLAAYKNSFSCR